MDDIRKLLAGIASVAVIVFIFFQSYFGSDVAISSGKFALATNGAENSNERLEFLGDAMLSAVIATLVLLL